MESLKRNRTTKQLSDLDDTEIEVSQREMLNMWWFFYCRADKKVFELNFNHSSWPKQFTNLDKLALQPKEQVVIKANGVDYNCQFVKRIDSIRSVRELRQRASEMLENAEETLAELSFGDSFDLNKSSQVLEKENYPLHSLPDCQSQSSAPSMKSPNAPPNKKSKKAYEQSSIELCHSTPLPKENPNTVIFSLL